MYSFHIDTARTWRGGQNQVLLTVNGLRAAGHRATLVAHPDGELRRRAAEGLDLIPLAPRNEMDLSAAWKLSRLIKRLRPDILHAHDPHGIAMASLALSLGGPTSSGSSRALPPTLVASRRVDFHLKGNSFSRWKNRQVDCFIAASEAIRQMLLADGIPPAQVVTVHEGIDVEHVVAAPPVNVHEAFWLPHHAPVVGNVAALVPHKGQRYLIDAAHLVVQDIPDARFIILGEGELREHLEKQIRDHHLEKHVLLPGFRTDVLGCIKGFDLFVMFPHQGLDSVRALRPLLSRSAPNGGDWATVNVGPVATDDLFEQHSVPGYRQIVDLSSANDSRFIDAVGESGHFLSPHYDDFLADWRAVRHRKMRMDRKEVEAGAVGHLTLTPR